MMGMKTYMIGIRKILPPMKEIPLVEQLEEKLVPAKLEEPSNTHIEKQVIVIKKEIVNDEFRIQVIEPNLDQLEKILKKLQKLWKT